MHNMLQRGKANPLRESLEKSTPKNSSTDAVAKEPAIGNDSIGLSHKAKDVMIETKNIQLGGLSKMCSHTKVYDHFG